MHSGGFANRRAMLLRGSALLLSFTVPASFPAAELRLSSRTYLLHFERDLPGESREFSPLYEYLSGDASGLGGRPISFHFCGWGRLDLGDDTDDDGRGGDLASAYFRYVHPTGNGEVRLGRFFLAVLAAGCSTGTVTSGLNFVDEQGNHPAGWIETHPSFARPDGSACAPCHGDDLRGGIAGVSCFTASRNGQGCHAGGPAFHPSNWLNKTGGNFHGQAFRDDVLVNGLACTDCHDPAAPADPPGFICLDCHFTIDGQRVPSGSAFVHGQITGHTAFFTDDAVNIVCQRCHETNNTFGNMPQPFCHNCHEPFPTGFHPTGWASPEQHGAGAKGAPGIQTGERHLPGPARAGHDRVRPGGEHLHRDVPRQGAQPEIMVLGEATARNGSGTPSAPDTRIDERWSGSPAGAFFVRRRPERTAAGTPTSRRKWAPSFDSASGPATSFMFPAPVSALALAAVLLAERPTLLQGAAGAIMLAGVWWMKSELTSRRMPLEW